MRAGLVVETINKYPNLSKSRIARVLHTTYPDLFRTHEDARSAVRFATGASGDKLRRNMKTVTDQWRGPLGLPKPSRNSYVDYNITAKTVGVLSDIHIPSYDAEALNVAVKYLKRRKPEVLLLNGDILDCYHLSNFEKDPRERDILGELKMCRQFLDGFLAEFPRTHIIFKLGNHEDRWERKIISVIPQLAAIEAIRLENVMASAQFGGALPRVTFVGDKRVIRFGKLNIIHGHEWGKTLFDPVNPARTFFLRGKSNAIGGHYHQSSEHTEQDMNRSIVGTWSTGCLCDLSPAYRPLNKWNHGFAYLTAESGGAFQVENFKIIGGRVV
jgi:predicted phosphodiesterase